MKYETTITSKGTITIAAPIRKALGLKTGQKIGMFINKNKNVEIDTGISIQEFKKLRDEILKKVTIPDHLKGLTARELRDLAFEDVGRR
ncbi:MAG: AbrB/MazE/SpoVT family DNA-binding domain-containing protein [Pyrinomonadaceae bacterium]